ncbi:MAG: AMP-binding protein [Lentisphaeria bacterium]|nr:AMP-binding protein [Lentisphaeria bacterium]
MAEKLSDMWSCLLPWLAEWYPALIAVIVFLILCSPRLTLKIAAWIVRVVMFRLRVVGKENMPYSGPILLVSNHVSLIDLLMIQSVVRQRVRFMVRSEIVNFIPTRLIFWYLGVLKVPSARRPKEMKKFFGDIQDRLRAGETICFFPEGAISGSGNLMRFRSGVQSLIPPEIQVTVMPIRLGMIHGRLTGIYKNRLRFHRLTRWPVDFSVAIGKPIDPNLSAFQLRQKISELGAISETPPQPGERPIHTAFIYHAKRHLFGKIFYDATSDTWFGNFKMLLLTILLSKFIRKVDKGTAGYTGVLLPNMPIAAGVMLAIQCADRTPAIMNFSAGQPVALESMRRAGVKTILTSRKFLAKLKWEESEEMVFLEDVVPTITKGQKILAILMILFLPTRTLVRNIAPLSCYNMFQQAALLFSSGSTGKPKAVMLTQRNINCDIQSFIRVVDWSGNDRVAGNLPIFHSFGFTVCFALSATTGTPVAYVANPLDAGLIVKSCREFKITILCATPTFLQKYMMKAKPEDFKTLRLCITGAEKLRSELAERYRNMTGRDIVEGFGCTELSPIVTINLNNSIYTMGTKSDHPGSIGCPLPGIHARIVDINTGVELPPGKDGKLQVRAGSVMKGYLNDPELTAQVIQNNYYDTGDIGHMDEDGYIYITGRASRFSKIGGEMVPHEGVEDAIAKLLHSETREVAVAGRSDRLKGERLVIFHVIENIDTAAIIAGLREAGLPNIWIPKADDFVKVDALPLLGSGKLDLMGLKEMVRKLEN